MSKTKKNNADTENEPIAQKASPKKTKKAKLPSRAELILLGKIGKPVGLQGHALLWPYNIFSEHIICDQNYYLLPPLEQTKKINSGHPEKNPLVFKNPPEEPSNDLEIQAVRLEELFDIKSKSWRILLDPFYSREEIQNFVHWDLAMEKSRLQELEAGEYFVQDLIGLEVFEEGASKPLGIVDGVEDVATQQNLSIKLFKSFWGQHYLDIPLLEEYVREVNLAQKKIVIKPVHQIYEG